jgi:hypothetical protein
MFQLFYTADSWVTVGDTVRAEWTLRSGSQAASLPNGAMLKIDVDLVPAAAGAILRKGFLSGMDCSGDAAR